MVAEVVILVHSLISPEAVAVLAVTLGLAVTAQMIELMAFREVAAEAAAVVRYIMSVVILVVLAAVVLA